MRDWGKVAEDFYHRTKLVLVKGGKGEKQRRCDVQNGRKSERTIDLVVGPGLFGLQKKP